MLSFGDSIHMGNRTPATDLRHPSNDERTLALFGSVVCALNEAALVAVDSEGRVHRRATPGSLSHASKLTLFIEEPPRGDTASTDHTHGLCGQPWILEVPLVCVRSSSYDQSCLRR